MVKFSINKLLIFFMVILLFYIAQAKAQVNPISISSNTTVNMNGYYVFYYQNQSGYMKGQTGFLSITIKNFNGSYCTNCVINGTIGDSFVTFINQNNGNYSLYYTFNSSGFTFVNLTIYHPDFPSPPFMNGQFQTWIYVSKIVLYVNLEGGHEYKSGDELKIVALIKDDNGSPITGATNKITIYYPNNSIWVDNTIMNELENGLYYYNTILPDVEGVYTVYVNSTYKDEWAFGITTFHVISLTNETENWNKLWDYWNCSENNNKICNFLIEINQTTFNTNSTVNLIRVSQVKNFRVELSDFDAITAGSKYYAKVYSYDFEGTPKPLSELPKITIYDSLREIIVNNATMNYLGNGVYGFNFTTSPSAIGGVWETIVIANYSNTIVYLNDYWSISTSPADVKIVAITDDTIPTITAQVSITNMGTQGSDFQYVYCIVAEETNLCGGGDDIDMASETKYIGAGQTWTTLLSLDNVNSAGTYWFKIKAKALGETKWAGASKQFYARTEVIPVPAPPAPPPPLPPPYLNLLYIFCAIVIGLALIPIFLLVKKRERKKGEEF